MFREKRIEGQSRRRLGNELQKHHNISNNYVFIKGPQHVLQILRMLGDRDTWWLSTLLWLLGRNTPVALRGESTAVPLQLCREDKPRDTEAPIQTSQGLLGRYWPVFSAEMQSDCTWLSSHSASPFHVSFVCFSCDFMSSKEIRVLATNFQDRKRKREIKFFELLLCDQSYLPDYLEVFCFMFDIIQ